jgi:hypothetical protein
VPRSRGMIGAMWSRARALAVVATVFAYLAFMVCWALGDTSRHLRLAAETAGRSPREVRAMVFGGAYVHAVERIRQMIGRDEPYLVDQVDASNALGSMFWVRYDLLPRRAIAARSRAPVSALAGDCWKAQVRWEVVGLSVGAPPLLLARAARVPLGCSAAPWLATTRAAPSTKPPP